MPAFLIDEDLPRSLAKELLSAGYRAVDVRDVGLRGKKDSEVFAYAVAEGFTLVTADVEFGSLLTFPLGSHAGIIVVRLPNDTRVVDLVKRVVAVMKMLRDDDILGNLVIIERERVRLRRQ